MGLRHAGTEEGAAVVEEVLGNAVVGFVDEVVRHVSGFCGDFFDVYEFVVDRVVEDRTFDDDGAIALVPHGELDGFFAYFASFAGITI